MCGCSSCPLVRASRTKRSASPGDGVRPRSSTFTATSRFCAWSRTRNTAAKPPSPSRSPTVNSLPSAFWRRRRSVARSSDMADAKPRNARRWALGTAGVALAWLLGVWPPPLWWRDHWPRASAMMRERGPAPVWHLTPLKDISPVLQRMVIIGEDSRFRTHHGIDPSEIADALGADREGGRGFPRALIAAWRQRDRLRGASTITQQLAKNLYLSSSRNPLRKLKEAVTALRLELALPKDRILELYLDVAEWGLGSGCGEPRLLWRTGVATLRRAGGRTGGDAAAPPHLEPDVSSGAHARAAQPDPREVPRGGGVHSAGRGGHGAGRAAGGLTAHRFPHPATADAHRHRERHDEESDAQHVGRRVDGETDSGCEARVVR